MTCVCVPLVTFERLRHVVSSSQRISEPLRYTLLLLLAHKKRQRIIVTLSLFESYQPLSLYFVQFSSQFLDILPRYWNEKIETQVLWRKTTTTTTATIRYKRLNRCKQKLVLRDATIGATYQLSLQKSPPPFLPKNGRNAEPDFCCHNFGL